MSGLIFVVNIILVWASLFGIIVSGIYLLYLILSKRITVKLLFKTFSICGVFIFIIYLIYYAGLYQSMKIDDETINRLLSVDIEKIDVSDFEEKDYPKIYSYVNNEYQIEDLLSEPYIEISRNKSSSFDFNEYISNDLKFKIFGKVVNGTNSTIVIYPRESDRDFYDMYLFSQYGYWNKVLVINGNNSLEISYLCRQNNEIVLNKILDNLISQSGNEVNTPDGSD